MNEQDPRLEASWGEIVPYLLLLLFSYVLVPGIVGWLTYAITSDGTSATAVAAIGFIVSFAVIQWLRGAS